MAEISGAKLSTSEYAARKMIDVAAAVAVPLASFTAGYVVFFHGEDIANAIKTRLNRVKTKRN